MSAISQREARRLKKRVAELEHAITDDRYAWASAYVGGVDIGRANFSALPKQLSAIVTARKLRHAVVVTTSDDDVVFHALPATSV